MGDQLAVVKKLLVLEVITSVFHGLMISTAATTLAMAAANGRAILGKLVEKYWSNLSCTYVYVWSFCI